ncbi:MAG: carboxypeptidase regulatory-like domain-containing protein [Spirochaetaceae bacterium]|nr:carboxypeptidase regulatory-like domain-containing protein [Spirochaetaceae bacterium]
MKKILLLITLTALLFISCKSEPEGYFESSSLPGMIYDADNRPCDKVILTIWLLDEVTGGYEEMNEAHSDINGRFTFPELSRGSYRVIAEKEGYEAVSTEFYYSSRLEVLYLKIFSQKQILNLATDAMNDRRFGKVQDLLQRSEAVNIDDPYSLYLKSIYLYEKKEFESALIPLMRIEDMGYRFAYVHLLMADIYEYELDDRDNALIQLNKYLNLIDNSEVNLRKKELENNEI